MHVHKTKSLIINYWPIIMINYLGYNCNSIGYSYLVITTDSSVLSNGVSERIRKACEKFGLKVVFKSGPTLRSLLTRVKDPPPPPPPWRSWDARHVQDRHHWWFLLRFLIIWVFWWCRWFLHRGDGTNEWYRVAILLESSCEVVFFLLQVLLL